MLLLTPSGWNRLEVDSRLRHRQHPTMKRKSSTMTTAMATLADKKENEWIDRATIINYQISDRLFVFTLFVRVYVAVAPCPGRTARGRLMLLPK